MQVLFLALGANRAQAAVVDSAQVVADGGRPVVLVDQRASWRRMKFDPAVKVVELSRLEATRLPVRIERFLLHRAPRKVFRAVGRGPLRTGVEKVSGTYEARFADRVHRRLVMLLYRAGWGERSHSVIRGGLPGDGIFDLIVVVDPASMPYAAGLIADYEARGLSVPRVAFGLDYAASAVGADDA
ncbi:hypothetical protein GA0074692_3250 [Micromonospora pallida]|uniref:Uncharacterized protein n=1 Tax=Micromonospora pallida TaxID=145854 RepID=A0A1C6SS32_9ACTN|nr:hypothetical protein [Micromonospora pallida]SCL32159.1 hypothetical protein GA0074692_3250 [Micromonospora pallida]